MIAFRRCLIECTFMTKRVTSAQVGSLDCAFRAGPRGWLIATTKPRTGIFGVNEGVGRFPGTSHALSQRAR
jgi:hypothetical protein